MLELFTLFFKRFHSTQLILPRFPPRRMIDAQMHMWGKLLPKRGQSECTCTTIGREIYDFLAGEDNCVLDLVQYPYARMDWSGFPHILFTTVEKANERGNIIVMF
jgi:hypothetical protein